MPSLDAEQLCDALRLRTPELGTANIAGQAVGAVGKVGTDAFACFTFAPKGEEAREKKTPSGLRACMVTSSGYALETEGEKKARKEAERQRAELERIVKESGGSRSCEPACGGPSKALKEAAKKAEAAKAAAERRDAEVREWLAQSQREYDAAAARAEEAANGSGAGLMAFTEAVKQLDKELKIVKLAAEQYFTARKDSAASDVTLAAAAAKTAEAKYTALRERFDTRGKLEDQAAADKLRADPSAVAAIAKARAAAADWTGASRAAGAAAAAGGAGAAAAPAPAAAPAAPPAGTRAAELHAALMEAMADFEYDVEAGAKAFEEGTSGEEVAAGLQAVKQAHDTAAGKMEIYRRVLEPEVREADAQAAAAKAVLASLLPKRAEQPAAVAAAESASAAAVRYGAALSAAAANFLASYDSGVAAARLEALRDVVNARKVALGQKLRDRFVPVTSAGSEGAPGAPALSWQQAARLRRWLATATARYFAARNERLTRSGALSSKASPADVAAIATLRDVIKGRRAEAAATADRLLARAARAEGQEPARGRHARRIAAGASRHEARLADLLKASASAATVAAALESVQSAEAIFAELRADEATVARLAAGAAELSAAKAFRAKQASNLRESGDASAAVLAQIDTAIADVADAYAAADEAASAAAPASSSSSAAGAGAAGSANAPRIGAEQLLARLKGVAEAERALASRLASLVGSLDAALPAYVTTEVASAAHAAAAAAHRRTGVLRAMAAQAATVTRRMLAVAAAVDAAGSASSHAPASLPEDAAPEAAVAVSALAAAVAAHSAAAAGSAAASAAASRVATARAEAIRVRQQAVEAAAREVSLLGADADKRERLAEQAAGEVGTTLLRAAAPAHARLLDEAAAEAWVLSCVAEPTAAPPSDAAHFEPSLVSQAIREAEADAARRAVLTPAEAGWSDAAEDAAHALLLKLATSFPVTVPAGAHNLPLAAVATDAAARGLDRAALQGALTEMLRRASAAVATTH